MYDRLFHWTMARGAKVLFALALFSMLLGLALPVVLPLLSETSRLAANHNGSFGSEGSFDLPTVLNGLTSGLGAASFPLFGAVLAYQAERYVSSRTGAAARAFEA